MSHGDVWIRDATSVDAVAIRELLLETMGQTESDLVEALRDADALTLCMVAEMDDQVIGVNVCSPGSAADVRDYVGLGPICVRDDRQRRGIGGRLMRAAIDRLRDDTRAIFLLGHPEYYPRFGFEPAIDYNFRYRSPAFDGAFMVLPRHDLPRPSEITMFHYHPAFEAIIDRDS